MTNTRPIVPTSVCLNGEAWKQIDGYGGRYFVSNLGRVYTSGVYGNGKIMSPHADSHGFLHVCFSDNGKVTGHSVSHIVAEAFCERGPRQKDRIRHLDGDPCNNRADNLAWESAIIAKNATPKLTPDDYLRMNPSMLIDGEVWVTVSGYEDRYYVSNMGRVFTNGCKGVPPHIMKPQPNNRGYMLISLSKNKKVWHTTVHRLVAAAFCEGRSNERPHVNHIDGDKSNNVSSNLEWVSRSENMRHAIDVLHRNMGCHEQPASNRKLTKEQVLAIRSDSRSCGVIANELGVTPRTIYCARKGITYKDVN